MTFKIGDQVTRNSYNNDTIFVITDIVDDICYLNGVNIRLSADSPISDLKAADDTNDIEKENDFISRLNPEPLERNDYFYLPGKILHIDGDSEYLNRCLKYYSSLNIWAMGIMENEENIASKIQDLIKEYNPNIVVITGHDAYYKKRGKMDDLDFYKNSKYFVDAVREARKLESSHEKLIIIAGGCQSNYEELIKAGANFASSPKRINIHALDPAIIASGVALYDRNKTIDLIPLLSKTKYGADGIGGVATKGCMFVGYPR